MEEIEKRFEIIRIAVSLADYETIEVQIRHLRNMSTDKHLHDILLDLGSRNFRQALYSMRDYAESLRDDFFAPSLREQETTPRTEPVRRDEPTAVTNDLFSAPPPTPSRTSGGERVLGLEEMLQMTRESASAPRSYTQPSRETEKSHVPTPETRREFLEAQFQEQDSSRKIVEPEPKPVNNVVEPSLSTEPDPLFTLDQEMPSEEEIFVPEREVPPVPDPVEDHPVSEIKTATQDTMDMTPLFATDEQPDDDFLAFSPPLKEETDEQEPEEQSAETAAESEDLFASGMFALEEEFDAVPVEADDSEKSMPVQAQEAITPEKSIPVPEHAQQSNEISQQTAVSELPSETREEPEEPTTVQGEEPEPTPEPQGPRRWEIEPDLDEELYEKFAYMGQKFRNMMHQYPQIEEYENGVMDEVRSFIHMVSTRDYAESQIEAVIERYQELKAEGRRAEAAQMLIAAATTESTFAQFMLARELFKGEVLQQDYPESFTQINRLAEEDYPEAICDLGQLYEYGIGIDKNKRHALLLYEEAAEMGVERAKVHYERLKNTNPIQSIKALTTSLLRKRK